MSAEKDMLDIIHALSSIFEGYGARVSPSNTDPVYLRVVHGDTRIAVGFQIASDPVRSIAVGDFLARTLDSFYHLFVFISNHPLQEDTLEYARNHNIILLDREDLEIELGKAHLKTMEMFHHPRIHIGKEEDEEDLGLVRWNILEAASREEPKPELILVLESYRKKHTLSGSSTWPPPTSTDLSPDPFSSSPASPHTTSHPPSPSHPLHTSQSFIIPDHVSNTSFPTSPDGTITDSFEEREDTLESLDNGENGPPNLEDGSVRDGDVIPQGMGKRIHSGKGLIIAPKLTITQLNRMCQRIGGLTNSQMELIPYFMFGYSCAIFEEGTDHSKQSYGLLAINGVTLEVEEWEPGFETVEELTMDYVRLVPRADKKVARDLAHNGVVQLNTRVLEVKAETNGIVKDMSKKLIPDTSSIRLDYQGLLYFPHWHVRGIGGTMFVDGVNGEVISLQKEPEG